jgi:hypothetical protein
MDVAMSWKEDLNYGLQAFGLRIPDSVPIDDLTSRLADSPARNTLGLVVGSAAAFYAAEKGHNPKVRDIYDALVYCSTCISVGYSDIFAKTPAGKLIGSLLMTIGPAMAPSTLNGPGVALAHAQSATRRETVQEEMLSTLKVMLEELRAQNSGSQV